MQSLVEEVKKHLQEDLHPQVDGLYDEYNVGTPMSTLFYFSLYLISNILRVNSRYFLKRGDESMIESEAEMGTKVIDPVKENMRIFLRIEGM